MKWTLAREISVYEGEANKLEEEFCTIICQFRWSLPLIGTALPVDHLDPRIFSRSNVHHILQTHIALTARLSAEFFPISERLATIRNKLMTSPRLSTAFGSDWSNKDVSSLEHANGLECLALLASINASMKVYADLHDK